MEIVFNFAKQLHKDISDQALGTFVNLFTEVTFSKNEVFIETGDSPLTFYLVKSGVARSYHTDEKGKEFIRSLFTPVSTIGSLNSLLKGKPSELTYDCLTDCVFLEADFTKLIELTKKDLEIAFLYSKLLEVIIFKFIHRINELSTFNATELYLKLKVDIPHIDNLISQYHIAEYLNITPVQLSRIRKKIYSI